MRKQKI